MQNLVNYIYIATLFISMVLAVVFSYYNWGKGTFKRLLSLQFGIIAYALFTNFLAAQNLFIQFPHFSRTGFISVYLLPAIIFLAVYREIYKKGYRWFDILHFLPVILYILNYATYFILSAEEKIAILKISPVVRFNEGFLPSYSLPVLAILQTVIYILWLGRIFKQLKSSFLPKAFITLIKYLWGYLIIQVLPVLMAVLYYFEANQLLLIVPIVYAFANIILSFKVLSSPALIFERLQNPEPVKKRSTGKRQLESEIAQKLAPNRNNLSPEESKLLDQFIYYVENEHTFLRETFSQKKAAIDLSVSEYKIRQLLERTYGLKFSEFSNLKKIHFLLKEIKKNKEWQKYTIAALSKQLGYNSINSFYLNFKKITGLTPKEYFELR